MGMRQIMNEIFPKISILLALSNGQAAEAYKPILRTHGIKKAVAVVSNGDALERLKDGNINLIVMDEGFSELGGYDFCRFLRLTSISASVSPIIFGLHNPDQKSVLMARDSGASKIVSMPLTGVGLIKAVTSALTEMKPIIQHSSYRGPDRRRPNPPPYTGPERRQSEATTVSVMTQRKVMMGKA